MRWLYLLALAGVLLAQGPPVDSAGSRGVRFGTGERGVRIGLRPPGPPVGTPPMGRVRTIGFEVGFGDVDLDGFPQNSGTTIQSSIARTGVKALKADSGAGNNETWAEIRFPTLASGNTVYVRAYVYFTTLPTAATHILVQPQTSRSISVNSSGQWVGPNGGTGGAVQLNTWYMLELSVTWTNSGASSATGRVDRTVLDTISFTGGVLAPQNFFMGLFVNGFGGGPGANSVCYVDDLAVNDSNGSSQNSWPGDGKIVLCQPISDNQRGSWTGGAGGTTNLFDAVNNTPPIGTATETNLTQIENADTTPDNATDEYRVNLTTYTNAGIATGDTVVLAQAVVNHGEDVATGTKTGSVAFQSNPVQSGVDAFTFGNNVGALGTWPTNWRTVWGTAQYLPSVTKGSSPVLALRKTDTGSRVASCDFLGAYVEYNSPSLPVFKQQPRTIPQRRQVGK